jgi:hypothetical protein
LAEVGLQVLGDGLKGKSGELDLIAALAIFVGGLEGKVRAQKVHLGDGFEEGEGGNIVGGGPRETVLILLDDGFPGLEEGRGKGIFWRRRAVWLLQKGPPERGG